MENDSKTERIDRYLDEEMSAQEQYAFESQMAGDRDLKLEVEAQDAVRNLIREQAQKHELRNLFDTFQKDLDDNARKEIKNTPVARLDTGSRKKDLKINWGNWSYMAIAASIALTILGVWTIVKQKNQIGDQVEVRKEKESESFRIPLLTWDNERFKPVLREKQMLDLNILRSKQYKSHYKFTNTLEIYSDTLTEKRQKISVAYDLDTRQYVLHIGNQSYQIGKTENIIPLPQPK